MKGPQIFLAIVFGASCLYTVLGYPVRYSALSGRSRLYRFVAVILLDLLLGLLLLGTFIEFRDYVNPIMGSFRALAYGSACIFLALALVCLAVLDALESLVAYRREQRRLLSHMLEEETPPGQPPGTDDPGKDGNGRS